MALKQVFKKRMKLDVAGQAFKPNTPEAAEAEG